MKIGALASSLKKPLPETLQIFAGMGLQGVQIGLSLEWLDYSDEKIAEIRNLCAENRLEISAVCGDIGGHAFHVESECMVRSGILCKFADIASKLGTKVITTHIGVIPEDHADPVYPLMLKSIRAAAEYSVRLNVRPPFFLLSAGQEKSVQSQESSRAAKGSVTIRRSCSLLL